MDILILCGGNGTRLFPLSRTELPKQFLPLTEKEKTMFEITLDRTRKIEYEHLYIICNEKHFSLIENIMKGEKNFTIITEPIGRNTCPAISIISHLSSSKSLLVLSSDHIWDDNLFIKIVKDAKEILHGTMVVFGIQATYPETGYGYIHYKENKVLSFVEKPEETIAKQYYESGEYVWNSGNFLFSLDFLRLELKKWVEDIYYGTKMVLEKSLSSKNKIQLPLENFQIIRDQSIDYSIMEKQKDCKIILYRGKWSDIGSFQALYDFLPKDENGHVNHHNESKIISLESKNSFLHSKKNVCLIGIEDLCIIDTQDILFIGDLKKSQEIKKIVEMMKKKKEEL